MQSDNYNYSIHGRLKERRFDVDPATPAPDYFASARSAYRAMTDRGILAGWVGDRLTPAAPRPRYVGPGGEVEPASGIMDTSQLITLCAADTGLSPSPNEMKGALLDAGYAPLISTEPSATHWRFGIRYA